MTEVPQGEHATFSFLDLITLALVLDAIPDFTHAKVLDGFVCLWLAYANHAIGVRWQISRYLIPPAALTLFVYAFVWCIDIRDTEMKYLAAGFVGAVILIAALAAYSWIGKKEAPPETSERPATSVPPSLVFVFGAPLGDNDSATWVMVFKHFGPNIAYGCDIIFYDDDRKNIEHEWLVKHPDSPYPPSGLAGESQRRIYIPEAGPEGSSGSFNWNPVNPNSQHYTISISCREGVFEEKWAIARINGILRAAITIQHGVRWSEKNPNQDPVVFRYQDPEFMNTALAVEMPKSAIGKVVHPGWKPKYRFEVPAAIIDPNGNVEVVSGIKQPDGSTLTDFGSWNILTRHFGDTPDKKEH